MHRSVGVGFAFEGRDRHGDAGAGNSVAGAGEGEAIIVVRDPQRVRRRLDASNAERLGQAEEGR